MDSFKYVCSHVATDHVIRSHFHALYANKHLINMAATAHVVMYYYRNISSDILHNCEFRSILLISKWKVIVPVVPEDLHATDTAAFAKQQWTELQRARDERETGGCQLHAKHRNKNMRHLRQYDNNTFCVPSLMKLIDKLYCNKIQLYRWDTLEHRSCFHSITGCMLIPVQSRAWVIENKCLSFGLI